MFRRDSSERSPAANGDVPAVRLDSVSKVYGRGNGAVRALREVSVSLPYGTFTAVMGPSGSGKSTLLHVAAGLDRPTDGRVLLGTTDLSKLNATRLTELRRDRIGFVFQAFNLLPSLSVEHNVTLPLRLAGRRADKRAVAEVLARVGLSDRRRHRPSELSGGQQQRVALARALVTEPEVLFADEPTGALDLSTGREVLGLFREAVDSLEQTVVMVTHDPAAASYAAESVAERMTARFSSSRSAAFSCSVRAVSAGGPADRTRTLRQASDRLPGDLVGMDLGEHVSA